MSGAVSGLGGGIVGSEYDQNECIKFSNKNSSMKKPPSLSLRPLPKLWLPAYLRNCKEKRNEYGNSPATAEMT